MIIKRVYRNKKSKQKLVTIPRGCEIHEGDYVEITKIKTSRIKVKQFTDKEKIDWQKLNKEVKENESN